MGKQHYKQRYIDNVRDDKEQLFFESLSEIAFSLGNSLSNPISISLLCMEFGITNKEKEKLWWVFKQVLRENKFDQLSVSLFSKSIQDAIPIEELADRVVIAFIKAFARYSIPELEPFARSL